MCVEASQLCEDKNLHLLLHQLFPTHLWHAALGMYLLGECGPLAEKGFLPHNYGALRAGGI